MTNFVLIDEHIRVSRDVPRHNISTNCYNTIQTNKRLELVAMAILGTVN